MVLLLSSDAEPERLAKMPMEALIKLEKFLSAKKAKDVLSEAYINPPEGSDEAKRTALAKGEETSFQVSPSGAARRDNAAGRKPLYALPDGRNIRAFSKQELVKVYWEYYHRQDAIQRAAWASASPVSKVVQGAEGTPSKLAELLKAVEIRHDLRLISDIAKSETTEGKTEEYTKVANVFAQAHIEKKSPTWAGIAETTAPAEPKKRGRKRSNKVTSLPAELGGAPLASIKAADYPTVCRQVFFEHYGQDLLEEWMGLDSVTFSPAIRDWIYDGFPDSHKLKRIDIKNLLLSFLEFVQNGRTPTVNSVEEPPADTVTDVEEIKAAAFPKPSPPATEEQTGEADEKQSVRPKVSDVAERILYVGCMPMREEVVFLHDLLLEFQERVAEDAAVPHYSLIKYNEGAKRVAACLRQRLHEDSGYLPSRLVCDPGMPCSDAALEVLKPAYDQVVARVW
jgi:hypothetical protein